MSSNGAANGSSIETPAQPVRIFVLGDDTLCREGLVHVLSALPHAPDIEEGETIEDLQSALTDGRDFSLVFVSAMPIGADSSEVVEAVKAVVGRVPVAVLGLTDSPSVVRGAISAGAAGFLPAMASPRVIQHAVELMLSGGLYLPASVLGGGRGEFDGRMPGGPGLVRLTTRQEAVLLELAKGQSNKQIATVLGLSEATVKVHVAAIMRTLKAQNRTQAVLTATQVGILEEQAAS